MDSASLAARHAELVAARERNAAKLRELRAALAQAERDDYAFAAVVGELERLLALWPVLGRTGQSAEDGPDPAVVARV